MLETYILDVVVWKESGFQIMGAILGSSLVVTAFTVLYNDFYKLPEIKISVNPDESVLGKSIIQITNHGRSPATNMIVRIEAPQEILHFTGISAENISLKSPVPNLLEARMPRLVQGDGSIVSIAVETNSSDRISQVYHVYSTYDQGSTIFHKPLSFSNVIFPFNIIFDWIYLNIIKPEVPILPLLILGIGSVILILAFLSHRKKHKQQSDFILTIIEEMMTVRRTLQEQKQYKEDFPEDEFVPSTSVFEPVDALTEVVPSSPRSKLTTIRNFFSLLAIRIIFFPYRLAHNIDKMIHKIARRSFVEEKPIIDGTELFNSPLSPFNSLIKDGLTKIWSAIKKPPDRPWGIWSSKNEAFKLKIFPIAEFVLIDDFYNYVNQRSKEIKVIKKSEKGKNSVSLEELDHSFEEVNQKCYNAAALALNTVNWPIYK